MSKTIQDELREVRRLPTGDDPAVVGFRVPDTLALRAADEIDRLRGLVEDAYLEGLGSDSDPWAGDPSQDAWHDSIARTELDTGRVDS